MWWNVWTTASVLRSTSYIIRLSATANKFGENFFIFTGLSLTFISLAIFFSIWYFFTLLEAPIKITLELITSNVTQSSLGICIFSSKLAVTRPGTTSRVVISNLRIILSVPRAKICGLSTEDLQTFISKKVLWPSQKVCEDYTDRSGSSMLMYLIVELKVPKSRKLLARQSP